MIVGRPYNFRATLGGYVLAGVVVAIIVHCSPLSSPKSNRIFPLHATGTGISNQVDQAPGAKEPRPRL
jgi:hypothetical protein